MRIEKQRNRVGDGQRILSLAGGSALLVYGLRRHSTFGKALALAGGNFIFRGVMGEGHVHQALGLGKGPQYGKALHYGKGLPYGKGVKLRKSITVNRPVDELFRFWRNFENLPRFMEHLETVTRIDERRSHWVAKGPAKTKIEWDAEITTERENEIIGWRSLEGAVVDNAGSVRFEPGPPGRGTVVRVQLQYNPPGGRLGTLVAKLLGEEPEQQIQEDLWRFKEIMEVGEIPTTKGQPSGRATRERTFETAGFLRCAEAVETASEESFPASDPPSWNAGGL